MSRVVTAYRHGKPFTIIVVLRNGKLVETSTAAAYDEMATAAANAGHTLIIRSGWRSHEEQQRIWAERADPTVRAIKGVAAKPGWSNHQGGTALDLDVGMSLVDLQTGRKTPVFSWLEKNAHQYGFARTVASEPWHWERIILAQLEDRT